LVRYLERNALRAGLVARAEAWKWSSLWWRTSGAPEQEQLLGQWPVPYPRDWCKLVNQPQTEAEVAAICRCVARGQP
jgi:putative transposase